MPDPIPYEAILDDRGPRVIRGADTIGWTSELSDAESFARELNALQSENARLVRHIHNLAARVDRDGGHQRVSDASLDATVVRIDAVIAELHAMIGLEGGLPSAIGVTVQDLIEIRARWEKVTPGPWHPERDDWADLTGQVCDAAGNYVAWCGDAPLTDEQTARNIEAIAHAPADMETVLTVYDAERALREALEEQLRAVERELYVAQRDAEMWQGCAASNKTWYDAALKRGNEAVSQAVELRAQLTRAKAEGAREALERAAEVFRGNVDDHIERSNSFVPGDSREGCYRVKASEASRCVAYCVNEANRLAGEEPKS